MEYRLYKTRGFSEQIFKERASIASKDGTGDRFTLSFYRCWSAAVNHQVEDGRLEQAASLQMHKRRNEFRASRIERRLCRARGILIT